VREQRGIPLPPRERAELERELTRVQAVLSEKDFAAAWAEGQAMPLDRVIAEALELTLAA
jgi:hypothetical protein